MFRRHLIAIAFCFAPLLATAETGVCLTTVPQSTEFAPPAPYNSLIAVDGTFYYGTNALWTNIPLNGIWSVKGNSDTAGGYMTKLVYWRKGFDWRKEPKPKLTITANRMDGNSPLVHVSNANAVFVITNRLAMMTGLHIPTPGCWEITAAYKGSTLAFVVSVQP